MSSQGNTCLTPYAIVNAHFSRLLGRLLTIVEATTPTAGQCKSTKDLVRHELSEAQTSLNQQLQQYWEGLVHVRESATHDHN